VVRHEIEFVPVNDVRLVGRLSRDPAVRVLPSGDELWTFRVVVRRGVYSGRGRGPQGMVDALDCAVWSATERERVRLARAGDVVEVRGAVRRRFYPGATRTESRVEIDVGTIVILDRSGRRPRAGE
jgi:single-strand DNA-binding protein